MVVKQWKRGSCWEGGGGEEYWEKRIGVGRLKKSAGRTMEKKRGGIGRMPEMRKEITEKYLEKKVLEENYKKSKRENGREDATFTKKTHG